MTTFKPEEARILFTQEKDGVDVKVEGGKSANATVQQNLEKLVSLALTLNVQTDLFTGSNDPHFHAGVLIRQCNDLLEVTPFYSRDLPTHPPFSQAELMAGKLISRYVER